MANIRINATQGTVSRASFDAALLAAGVPAEVIEQGKLTQLARTNGLSLRETGDAKMPWAVHETTGIRMMRMNFRTLTECRVWLENLTNR